MSKRALAIDLIVLLAVWFVAAEALDLRMLPSPLQVLEVFWSELTEGKLGMHLLISTGASSSAPRWASRLRLRWRLWRRNCNCSTASSRR